jgi:hypothetical protein
MKVDKDEFTRIIDNLLKMKPKKRADSKLGTKKKTGKVIPPQTPPSHQPKSDKATAESHTSEKPPR